MVPGRSARILGGCGAVGDIARASFFFAGGETCKRLDDPIKAQGSPAVSRWPRCTASALRWPRGSASAPDGPRKVGLRALKNGVFTRSTGFPSICPNPPPPSPVKLAQKARSRIKKKMRKKDGTLQLAGSPQGFVHSTKLQRMAETKQQSGTKPNANRPPPPIGKCSLGASPLSRSTPTTKTTSLKEHLVCPGGLQSRVGLGFVPEDHSSCCCTCGQ